MKKLFYTTLIIFALFGLSGIFFLISLGVRNIQSAKVDKIYIENLKKDIAQATKEAYTLGYKRGYDDAVIDVIGLNPIYIHINIAEFEAVRSERFAKAKEVLK